MVSCTKTELTHLHCVRTNVAFKSLQLYSSNMLRSNLATNAVKCLCKPGIASVAVRQVQERLQVGAGEVATSMASLQWITRSSCFWSMVMYFVHEHLLGEGGGKAPSTPRLEGRTPQHFLMSLLFDHCNTASLMLETYISGLQPSCSASEAHVAVGACSQDQMQDHHFSVAGTCTSLLQRRFARLEH